MTKTLDDNTQASYPCRVRLSHAKLKILQPELYHPLAWVFWDWQGTRPRNRRSFWLTHIKEHLLFGDSRAAVVITTAPLLVAAYTDELDCVALLRFNDSFVSEYDLTPGSRLVSANLYEYMNGSYESDLKPGPGARGYYRSFTPLIADFLTDDVDRLAERKAEISEDEWRRTEELGQLYLNENYAGPRDGRPFWCSLPADQVDLPGDPQNVDSAKPVAVSLLEIPKTIFFVIIFGLLLLWSVTQIPVNPRVGWFAVAVFGTMLTISIVTIYRLPRDLKTRVGLREALSFKSAYMWTGTLAISFFLGLAGELILGALNGFWPNFAIWISCFVTTAAFYPFRGDLKKDYPNFSFWAIYSGLCGFISVAFAHFVDWLERG